jgi:hypothetical protein
MKYVKTKPLMEVLEYEIHFACNCFEYRVYWFNCCICLIEFMYLCDLVEYKLWSELLIFLCLNNANQCMWIIQDIIEKLWW